MQVIELETEINTLSSVKIVIHYLTRTNSFPESLLKSDELKWLSVQFEYYIFFKILFWRQHYGAKETFYSVVGVKKTWHHPIFLLIRNLSVSKTLNKFMDPGPTLTLDAFKGPRLMRNLSNVTSTGQTNQYCITKTPRKKSGQWLTTKKINVFCQEQGLSLVLIIKWPLIAKQKHLVISLQSRTHPELWEKKSHNFPTINILKR